MNFEDTCHEILGDLTTAEETIAASGQFLTFSPNRCSMPVGSAPDDRMKMIGVGADVSLNTVSKSSGALSTNCTPNLSRTKSRNANTSFSSRKTRTSSSFWNASTPRAAAAAGSGAAWGSGAAAKARHSGSCAAMSWHRVSKTGTACVERKKWNQGHAIRCTRGMRV